MEIPTREQVVEGHENEVARLKKAGVIGSPGDLFLPGDNYKSLCGAEEVVGGDVHYLFSGTFDDIVEDVLNILAARIALDNRLKGFWPDGSELEDPIKMALYPETLGRNPGEMISLQHSELTESLEAIRSGGLTVMDDKLPEHSGYATEGVDAIIRVLDGTGGFGLQPGTILVQKLKYNRTRPYKHGRVF